MKKLSLLFFTGALAMSTSFGCGGDDDAGTTGGTGGSSGNRGGSSSGGTEGGGPSEGGGSSTDALANPVHVIQDSQLSGADGSEAHPFPSIPSAIAAIQADKSWDGKIIVHAGRYEIPDQDAIIPTRADLEVQAGVTIAVGPGLAIHAQRHVEVLGTEAKPVIFTWLVEGMHWSAFTIFEPTSQDNVFKWATFEHGHETQFNAIGMRGALSLNGSGALVSHCTFQNNEGDDGIGGQNASVHVEYSSFLNNASDALDFGGDKVTAVEIDHSFFYGNVNDGVDLGEGSPAYVHDNIMYKNMDKGVSMGPTVHARIENNLIIGNHIGIGDKDDSDSTMTNNTLYGNEIGLQAAATIAGYGPGKGVFSNNIIWGSTTTDLNIDPASEITISYNCISDLTNFADDTTYEGVGLITKGDGCDDPLFVNPDVDDMEGWDFHVMSEAGHFDAASMDWVTDSETSPAIDAGDPDADVGDEPKPNGGRRNLGRYGGTEEASKSP